MKREGAEPGREPTGDDDESGRATGESDDRDSTGVDPNEGNTDRTAG